ncbi:MAG: transcription elongation factor GreA [Actinomycetia bacterium]|nr:transcription elongation factor GreA [Actinomycetes bacterium]
MVEKQQLSQTAYDRLKDEHTKLTTAGRIDIAKKIEVARELGDLSENGDYHAAKEEQGKMEGRIAHLAAMLENSEIIESSGGSHVEHGSVVTITYEGDDTPEKYLVGSIEERHDDLDVISPGSPLGGALMGGSVGETVGYEAPGGTLRVTIQGIA